MTLDTNLWPSVFYLLGWKDHRYRYYYHYPEQTPDWEYWGIA